MKPVNEKQKELDNEEFNSKYKNTKDYRSISDTRSKQTRNRSHRRRNSSKINMNSNYNGNNINKIETGRLDGANFSMQKGPAFLDNVLNSSILSVGGINLEGLTVDNANLNRITTAGKLPIFGDNLYVDGALENGAFGDKGYILQEIVNELPFMRNRIMNVTDFNDATKNIYNVTAAMPFTMSKTIMHNYRGMSDISTDNHKVTHAETLFFEDVANITNTFLDTYGTKYVVNDLTLNGKPAFPYIMYYYDVTMLHVLSIFRHYSNFKSMLHYGEKVSVIRNDLLNELDGPIFKSSTMLGAQSAALSSLTKLPLPLKYHATFMASVYNNGKVTSGRITPMEYVNCDVIKPNFQSIKNKISDVEYIPSSVWQTVWEAADNVINAYDFVNWDTWTFNEDNINKWPVIEKRSELIKAWNTLTTALNNFYNQMIDYFVALQRGLKNNIIKHYTNPEDVISQVQAMTTIQTLANGVEGNNAMINAYNYVAQMVTTEMNNGVLMKGDFVPDLMLKGIISHDSVLIFIGEENQYIKLYDVSQDVVITINNPGVGKSKKPTFDRALHFRLKFTPGKELNTGGWRLAAYSLANSEVSNASIKFNHPFIHYLLGNAVVNLLFSAEMSDFKGTAIKSDIVVQDSRVYTTLEYTVNTIGKYISNTFKYWSTR